MRLKPSLADRSLAIRHRLLNSITDLFLLDRDPSDVSKLIYADMAIDQIAEMGGAQRRSYADRVAAAPTLPHAVAKVLGNDLDAEVARSVLKLSPVLTDADLISFALNQSQEHLVAIAGRAQVPEAVTDVLVKRGKQKVLHEVCSNEGAEISDISFKRLVQHSHKDDVLAGKLAERSDLAPERRERAAALAKMLNDAGAGSMVDTAHRQRLEINRLLTELDAGQRALGDIIIMLAREERAFHLSQVMGHAAGLAVDKILNTLMKPEGRPIACICKYVGLQEPAFRSVLEFRMRRLRGCPRPTDQDMQAYAGITPESAARVVNDLKPGRTLN